MNTRQEGTESQSPVDGENTFICPLCQVENRLTAKFCRRCGKSRSELEKSELEDLQPAPVSNSLEITFAPPMQENEAAPVTEMEVVEILDVVQNAEIAPVAQNLITPDAEVRHICLICQTKLRATDQFCSWCGAMQLSKDKMGNVISCPECRSQLPELANFCFSCGMHVGVNKRLRVRMPIELFQEEDAEFFPTFDA